MKRSEAREVAFILIFEKTFSDDSIEKIIENAVEARNITVNDFTVSLALGADKHSEKIDQMIADHSHKWSKDRISKVALAIMRISVYEILHVKDIPVSVSINEAVELAKKYGGDEDSAFVNGVLGGIARNTEE